MTNRIITAGLLSAIVTLLAVSAWIVATGGTDATIAGLKLSLHSPARPFFLAGLATIALVLIAPTWRSRIDRLVDHLTTTTSTRRALAVTIALIAAVVLTIALRHGSFAASAADSYGYITQAELWQHGVPRIEQPQFAAAPWPDAQHTFSPLGYRPSVDGAAIVPTYPPGYPLLMAAALTLCGQGSQFIVVPALAGITVIAVFLLGRRTSGPWAGLMATIWISVSPAFLFHSVIPMSDVPATAAWTLTLLLILRPTLARATAAGLCCGLAIAIRPNLTPLALLVLLMDPIRSGGTRQSILRSAAFLLAMQPAVLAMAFLSTYWYGAPFRSGYGNLSALFALHNLPTNVQNYGLFLWETQTIAIFLAPLAVWTGRSISPEERGDRVCLFVFAAGVLLSYVCYLPFETWDCLRFLLPAFPALLILTAAVFMDLQSRFPKAIGAVAIVTLVGTIALTSESVSAAKGAFDGWRSLQRFADVAAYARERLPPNAIFLTRLYSGSLRYYAGLQTMRWDVLHPDWLDRAIAYLREQGLAPVIVIEEGDEALDFRERFNRQQFGALDWAPAGEYRGQQVVHFYNPDDRHP